MSKILDFFHNSKRHLSRLQPLWPSSSVVEVLSYQYKVTSALLLPASSATAASLGQSNALNYERSLLYLSIFTAVSCSSIQPRYHTVGPHDSVAKIASSYGISIQELSGANPDDTLDRLLVGQKLFIPFEHGSGWDMEMSAAGGKSSSVGDDSYEEDGPTLVRRVAAVRTQSSMSGMSKKLNAFIWPVSGPVSSYFGMRRRKMHDGIDIVARGGTHVRAARSGHVIYATNRIGGYGNMVILRHVNGFATVYAHLKTLSVKRGQFALKGQKVGQVGRTGRASDYHLHFEIRRHREPINPLLYLRTNYVKSIVRN